MKNEVLAEHLRFFKETEEGQEELSEVDARSVARGEIRGEIRGEAKGFVKGELSMVTKLILTNKVPLELLAVDFSHYFRWLFANFRECSLSS